MKFYYLIVLFAIISFSSCQKDMKAKLELIHAAFDNFLLQDSVFALKESDPNWCVINNSNICNLTQMVKLQKEGYRNWKQPNLSIILEAEEFESVFQGLQQRVVFVEEDFPSNVKLISREELAEKTSLELSYFSYYLVSAPVISRDGEYGFIYFAQHCGMECGGGDLLVFKWEEGKWKKLLMVPIWLS